jgi:hypothetical protein
VEACELGFYCDLTEPSGSAGCWSAACHHPYWLDGLPERSRALCLKLVGRVVATIDDIDALEVFG